MFRVTYTESEVCQIDQVCCELQTLGRVIHTICPEQLSCKSQEIRDLACIVVERAERLQDMLQEDLTTQPAVSF